MLKSRKKVTKWNIVFHYYSIAFSVFCGVLLVPLYLKYIPLEIYGAWLATGNIVAWLTVVDPGISDVLRQQVGRAYGTGETKTLNDYLGSGTLLSFIISAIILLGGLVASDFLIDLIKLNDQTCIPVIKDAFILAVIGSSLMIFSFGFTSFSQGLLSSVGIGLVFVVATLTSLIINIVLLIKGYGLYSIPISQIFRAVILIAGNIIYIIWRYLQESLKYNFSIRGFSALAKLSGYNFLGRLGNVMSTQMDAFLVARYIGAEVAPILKLTKKGPELSRMFVERPPVAMLPALTNAWGSGEYEKVRKYTARLFAIILWMLGLIFSGFILFNRSFVSLWVGSSIYAGNTINLVIILGVVFSVIVSIFSNIFFALGKIKETSKINFVQSIITIASLYVGIKYFGLIGLVIAQVLSMLVFSAWYFPYKTLKFIKYDQHLLSQLKREITNVVIISVVITLFSSHIIFISNWASFFLFVSLVTLCYVVFLFMLSKQFKKEIRVFLIAIKLKFS